MAKQGKPYVSFGTISLDSLCPKTGVWATKSRLCVLEVKSKTYFCWSNKSAILDFKMADMYQVFSNKPQHAANRPVSCQKELFTTQEHQNRTNNARVMYIFTSAIHRWPYWRPSWISPNRKIETCYYHP